MIHKIDIRHPSVLLLFFLLLPSLGGISAQDFGGIATAAEFFSRLAERYGAVEDYKADIRIQQWDDEELGKVYYRRPNYLRIDYTEPEDQVLCVNEERMQVYIPKYSVVMSQPLEEGASEGAGANMNTSRGLKLLSSRYSIGYVSGPDPVSLDEESSEQVVKLKLNWRTTEEGFRKLVLSVNEDMLIRRIEGVTVGYEELQIDYTNIELNQGIPKARFDYEAPSSANTYENFLYKPEE